MWLGSGPGQHCLLRIVPEALHKHKGLCVIIQIEKGQRKSPTFTIMSLPSSLCDPHGLAGGMKKDR